MSTADDKAQMIEAKLSEAKNIAKNY